jgi:hypothetical protein
MKNKSINGLMFESYVNHNRANLVVNENKAQLKQMLASNKIDQEEFNQILSADNTPNKKYVGWVGRQYLKTKEPNAKFDWDSLRNAVTEFIAMVNNNTFTGEETNIEKYPDYEALQKKVSEGNEKAAAAGPSKKEAAADMEVDFNSKDALVVSPLSHEAARKLGLSEFAHRVNRETGQKDCAWCITYKNPTHWNDYTDNQLITFYFAKPKTQEKLQELQKAFPKRNVQSLAILVSLVGDPDKEQGKITSGYDADDKQMGAAEVKKYLNILGVPIDNEKAEKNV